MICTLSKKFAKKDPTHFDIFVIILMSVSGRCSGISRADGRNASLEHIMVEFTASTCPSLRGKPRLFFLQHFKGTSWVILSAQSSQAEALQKRIPWGCFAFSPVRKTAAPKKPTFCVFVWLLHIQLINPTENQGLFLSSWRISHHFIIAGGEGRWRILGGGNHDVFRGEKMEVSRR